MSHAIDQDVEQDISIPRRDEQDRSG